MKISASIVIYNEKKEILNKVIKSFLSIGDMEKELIIVDNSPNNDLKSFCENFVDIKYIFSGQNLGFGKGHNLAFENKTINSDIHMIINPDTYFEDLTDFLNWFSLSKDISLSIPKICNPDGTVQNVVRNIPTPISLIKRKLGVESGEISIDKEQISDIPFAHGCFLVFKTDIYKKINGFDERFFMYMEDIDIFIKAKKYGRTVINPNYKIYHEYRKGSSKNLKLFLWHLSSAIKFFWKYRKYNFKQKQK